MKSKSEILEDFALFSVPTGGIGRWLTEKTHDDVFGRLGKVDDEPLPAVQLTLRPNHAHTRSRRSTTPQRERWRGASPSMIEEASEYP
jgi:hypothetical protein